MRRRRDPAPPDPPKPPGAASVSLEHADPGPAVPVETPAEPRPRPVEAFTVLARFRTAARALSFAEQAMRAAQLDRVPCYREGAGDSWWIQARLMLGPAREMAGLGSAELYVGSGKGYVRDRGWGEDPVSGPLADLPAATEVTLLELVRVAGLYPAAAGPLRDAYVLLPGYLVAGLLERALDLRLQVTYQPVRLDPLFDAGPPARVCYAVRLSAPARPETGPAATGGTTAAIAAGPAAPPAVLPATLLAALGDDPFALVCRSVDDTLLIGYGTASPLSDRALARLVTAAGDRTWLLARPPDGCARLSWLDKPLDAANFVQLGPAHALTDLDGSQPYAEPAGQAARAVPRMLTLARATGRTSANVDAVLLDDADLDCLPLLLAGDPLADVAFLVRGAGRHLLSAPGGLLTELGVGEPLTCVGPGSVYLPAGWRLDPPVGPAARAALFQPEPSIAQVMLRDTRLAYDLDTADPVWSLWAGSVPALEPQLSRSALADLDEVAVAVGEPVQPRGRDRSSLRSAFRRPAAPARAEPSQWRQQAERAERDRDYVAAAQLYSRNNEPLRAARMWEREANEKY